MKIEDLKYLQTISKCKSFSAAAEKLFISRYALMRTINNLEDEFGILLFERTTSGVKLTKFGKDIIPKINEIVSLYDDMMDYAHTNTSSQKPILVGNYNNLATGYAFMRCVDEYNQSNSYKVNRVSCQGTDYEDMLLDGRLDFAFCLESTNENLSFIPLLEIEFALLVNNDNPLSDKPCISKEDLQKERIGIPEFSGGTEKALKRACGDCIAESIVYRSNDIGLIYRLVANNEFCAVLGMRDAQSGVIAIGDGKLKLVEFNPAIKNVLGLLCRKDANKDKCFNSFIEYVKANYSKLYPY